ncbi:MAG: hypothetical protein RLZZ196_2923 [Bacteroidota bacterium]|jgi:hypothetical protein
MKAKEFLIEGSYVHPDIRKIMISKGYKFLGKGIDQSVYLAPDGTILKIFGTGILGKYGNPTGKIELSEGHRGFELFVDYCKKHSNNPFLPQFSDWATFLFKGRTYLQIKMERLFPISYGMGEVLEEISIHARKNNSSGRKKDFINYVLNPDREYGRIPRLHKNAESFKILIGLIGEDGFNLLWDTIYDLNKTLESYHLKNRKYIDQAVLDLHPGNFMLGSDGQPVIADPFYIW